MKTFTRFFGFLVGVFSSGLMADDIDIYLGGANSGPPLVMLSIDYRPPVLAGNLCTYDTDCDDIMSDSVVAYLASELGKGTGDDVNLFEGFIAVLGAVISNPEFDPIHMGLMISNNIDNGEKTEGATILLGYRELGGDYTEDAAGNSIASTKGRQLLIDTLKELRDGMVGSSDAHQLYVQDQFMEWYSYLNSGEVFNGKKTITNYGNGSSTALPPDYDRTIMDDPTLGADTDYNTPFSPASDFQCSKLYGIMVAMNSGQGNPALKSEIENALSVDAAKSAENIIEYFNDNDVVLDSILPGDQTVNTWVISDENSKGTLPKWATAGGTGDGLLSLEDPEKLEVELEESFVEIISVSSTFVASSIPVNVFNRTELLDHLYTALFRAEETIVWPGNLKRLKLVDTDGNGQDDTVVDFLGNEAIESDGDDLGRIRTEALTFWTEPDKLPDADASRGEIDNRDGRAVPRGAAGQQVPGFLTGTIGDLNSDSGARQLFVDPSSGTTLVNFNADTPTVTELKTLLGVTDDPASTDDEDETLELIKWARGQDIDDEVPTPGGGDNPYPNENARNWILGASIHSRPLAVNYGTAGGHSPTNPNIRIYMGTTDGVFHSFENTTSGGVDSGKEVFGFMPRELLWQVPVMRANTQSSTQMIYGVDGAPTVLLDDTNGDRSYVAADGDRVYVYFGLRRGGKAYYGLDVSNPSAAPSLLWKITQTTGGDFDELGLSFSKPIVGKVQFGGTATDVVIFAGGYNGGWDSTYTNRIGKDRSIADGGDADDTVGNAIYIVNATTGALIWKAVQGSSTATDTVFSHPDMVDSIPSEITAMDSQGGGIIDRLYVGDTGGAVWRVDLPEGTEAGHRASNWQVTKLAELGTDGAATDLRFFHAPEVVQTFDSIGRYDGVLIASGNRADPLETDVDNKVFLIKDRATVSGSPASTEPVFEIDDFQDVTDSVNSGALQNGWLLRMDGDGEKALSKPEVLAGVVGFSSYTPASGVVDCEPSEGEGSVYFVNLADGSAFFKQRSYGVGLGIPGDVIKGGEGFIIPGYLDPNDVDDDDPISDGAGGGKTTDPGEKGIWRVYWREKDIDSLK